MRHYIAHCEACGRDFYGQVPHTPRDDALPCPGCGSKRTEVCHHGQALDLEGAKKALDEGRKVWWQNFSYVCFKDRLGQYLCEYEPNGHTVGLKANGNRGFFMD